MKPEKVTYWLGRIRTEIGTKVVRLGPPGTFSIQAHDLMFVLGACVVGDEHRLVALTIANARNGVGDIASKLSDTQQASLTELESAIAARTTIDKGVPVPDLSDQSTLSIMQIGARYASARGKVAAPDDASMLAIIAPPKADPTAPAAPAAAQAAPGKAPAIRDKK